MSPDISYEGDSSARLATVRPDDDAALVYVTREIMNPASGVSGVRIKEFASQETVRSLLEKRRSIMMKHVEGASFENELHTLGISQQGNFCDTAAYATKANAWRTDAAFMEAIGPDSSIMKKTIRTFETAYEMPLEPATEKGEALLPATLRCVDYANIHKDIVASEIHWEIARLRNDLAWNIYLRMPKKGGDLLLYPPAASHATKAHAIALFTPITVTAEPGDLIFFPSVIPHAVTRTSEPDVRLTISGCIGFEPPPEKKGRYWA